MQSRLTVKVHISVRIRSSSSSLSQFNDQAVTLGRCCIRVSLDTTAIIYGDRREVGPNCVDDEFHFWIA